MSNLLKTIDFSTPTLTLLTTSLAAGKTARTESSSSIGRAVGTASVAAVVDAAGAAFAFFLGAVACGKAGECEGGEEGEELHDGQVCVDQERLGISYGFVLMLVGPVAGVVSSYFESDNFLYAQSLQWHDVL